MADVGFGPVITVSASYGAAGSVIAPRLAEEFGIPFVDRMIGAEPSALAGTARSREGLVEGERESTPAGRFLSYFAQAASAGVVVPPEPGVEIEDDDSIRARTEEPMRRLLRGQPGVVLGRAGAVVLASRPRTFHVRLDGPVERRVAWASSFEGVDPETSAKHRSETDKARTQFVKRLYRADPRDPALYHLVLDTTVLGVEQSVRVIAVAARAFFEGRP